MFLQLTHRDDRRDDALRAVTGALRGAKPGIESVEPSRGPSIRFHTLGSIDVRDGEGQVRGALLGQPKRLALLTYLVLAHPRGFHRRDTVLGLFWPEFSQQRARNALNKALHFVRREIGADIVPSRGHEEIGVDGERLWCDAVAFEAALDGNQLEAAVQLYRGPLLEGLFLSDAPEFELWLEAERERLERRHSEALEQLAGRAAEAGDVSAAACWWRRAVEHQPLDGRPVLGLMEALVARGDRGDALLVAERHAARLRRELDAEPDPDVEILARRLRCSPATLPALLARLVPEPVPSSALPKPVSKPFLIAPQAVPRRRSLVTRWAALGVLIAIGTILLTMRDDAVDIRRGQAIAHNTGPSIAILGFRANDPTLERYEEAMSGLLARAIDGVGGLQATHLRAARERAAGPQEPPLDHAAALEAGPDTGANYIVLGDAYALGPEIRLTADIYRSVDMASAGRLEVNGPAGSLSALVNRISAKIVRTILREDSGGARVRHLSALTTESIEALEAYLEGEELYARSDFAAAIEAYGRAIQADSTFAMAHYRFALSNGWAGSDTPKELVDRAMRHAGRLPLREAMLIRAYHLWLNGPTSKGLDLTREIAEKWPDESEAWYLLGEYYAHLGAQLLADRGAGERALARAVALDPSFTPYQIHYFERAFLNADSATVAERLNHFSTYASGQAFERASSLAWQIAFGQPGAATRARASIESIPTGILRRTSQLLHHPRFWPERELLLREILARRDLPAEEVSAQTSELAAQLLAQGRLREAGPVLGDPALKEPDRSVLAHWLWLQGLGDPMSPERPAAQLAPPDSLSWFHRGVDAVDRGRDSDLRKSLRALHDTARQKELDGDSAAAVRYTAQANGLEGYQLWRTGHRKEAVGLLVAAQREHRGFWEVHGRNGTLCWWLALILLELNRPMEAARYLEPLWHHGADPYAAYELGRIYADLGRREVAKEAYGFALEAWRTADPELYSRVREVRLDLAQLEG